MTDTKKIYRAIRLFPLFDGLSEFLFFYSTVETLFLSIQKGLNAAQIAQLLFIISAIDLLSELPSFALIRKIGNSSAVIFGGVLPVAGIAWLIFANDFWQIAVALALTTIACNFQHLACGNVRNNLELLGKRDEFVKLNARSNIIFSVIAPITSVLAVWIYKLIPRLPLFLCLAFCILEAVLSVFMRDYSEKSTSSVAMSVQKKAMGRISLNRTMVFLLIAFCLIFCTVAPWVKNTELFIQRQLTETVGAEKCVSIFGILVFASQIIRIFANYIFPKILERIKESFIVVTVGLFCLVLAVFGIVANTVCTSWAVIAVACFSYLIVVSIRMPIRTYFRTIAADTNDKELQQFMLIALDFGQSIAAIVINGIAALVITNSGLNASMMLFGQIAAAAFFCTLMFAREMKQGSNLLKLSYTLEQSTIDIVADRIIEFGDLMNLSSEVITSYRLLAEEILLQNLENGKAGEDVLLDVATVNGNLSMSITVAGEKAEEICMADIKNLRYWLGSESVGKK